jgi:4-amino-4-deoxy-L-arabinose transferase-like glycosyltransferase
MKPPRSGCEPIRDVSERLSSPPLLQTGKDGRDVTRFQHAARIGLLMVGAAALLGWVLRHSEVCFADGLRYIHQAEQIDAGQWREGLVGGIDHPLHPLGIAAAHRLMGGDGPVSWERAALVLCFFSFVLLVVPVYLLAHELFGARTAWLAALLVIYNPIVSLIAVNVLSESTFLLFWTFGLWGSVRFLREGRFLWLPPAIGFGALAYLTRPEGMLLPVALTATLLILPTLPAARMACPRWSASVALVLAGLAFLVGPYIALKGGLGTKPGIARVLALAPRSQPLALERESPLPAGQTTIATYQLAVVRVIRALRLGGNAMLFPFALLGLVRAVFCTGRGRSWLFLGIILAVSVVGLVRLHVTGGYCGARHGVVPGMILTLAAAYGISRLLDRLTSPRSGTGKGRTQWCGLAAWTATTLICVTIPNTHLSGPATPEPFSVYHTTAEWLTRNTEGDELVLDLTDWSLYFSRRPGYHFANIYDAPGDPKTRWIVARKPHLLGRWYYSQVLRELIGGRQPVALIPPDATPGQVQIRIYDRLSPAPRAITSAEPTDPHHPEGSEPDAFPSIDRVGLRESRRN